MGLFSRSEKAAPAPTVAEPVKTREELTAITREQQTGDFMDPGRGPVQQNGRIERVVT